MIDYDLEINPFDDIAFNVEKVLHYISTMSILGCENSKSSFEDDLGILNWNVSIQNIKATYIDDSFSGNGFQFVINDDSYGSYFLIISEKGLMSNSYNANLRKSFLNGEGSSDVITSSFDHKDFKYLKGKKAKKMFKRIKDVMTCAVEDMKKENAENDAK